MSPHKTWSGLLGGMLCATGAASPRAGARRAGACRRCRCSAVCSRSWRSRVTLAESLAKRHFGVKDSSGLIPGHGGLLDRLDGSLTVIPAVALLSLVGGGSVVTWR